MAITPIYQEDLTWSTSGGQVSTTLDLSTTNQSLPRAVRGYRSFSVVSALLQNAGAVGNLSLLVSNASTGKDDKIIQPVDWISIDDLQVKIGQSMAGSPPPTSPFLQHVVINGFAWMALLYTPISGGGTMRAKLCGQS